MSIFTSTSVNLPKGVSIRRRRCSAKRPRGRRLARVIRVRRMRSRLMLADDVPESFFGHPCTREMYFFFTSRAGELFGQFRCAASFFATTMRPLVSLSRRWTIPAAFHPQRSTAREMMKQGVHQRAAIALIVGRLRRRRAPSCRPGLLMIARSSSS